MVLAFEVKQELIRRRENADEIRIRRLVMPKSWRYNGNFLAA